MTTILFRTVIIYVVLLTAMRLMGKRQIGELEISDLVTTLLVSEIASLPITDSRIPVSHAIIPIILLLTFEVVSSSLLVRFPAIKKYISTRPTTLIKNGKLSSEQMKKVRLSADELVSELRQNNISCIEEVEYAILEQNGKISVMQKPEYRPVTLRDMSMSSADYGLYRIIIENGQIDEHGIMELNITKSDVLKILADRKIVQKEVYLMMISDGGKINIIKKDNVR